MGGQVVHDDDIPGGLQGRNEHLLDIGAERGGVTGPSSTMGAVMPEQRSAPVKVVVFQCPCGTAARQRLPRSAWR